MNFQWKVSIESTKNVMCNGNKLMYARIIRSEPWLVVAEIVIFIDEIIVSVKDQFFKDFRANRLERHWSIVIAICLQFFCVLELCYLFSSLLEKLLAEGNFCIIDIGLVIVKLHNFTIRIEIPSWPWALCGFNPLINFKKFPQPHQNPSAYFVYRIFDFSDLLEECYC